jgi:hypothetical protein
MHLGHTHHHLPVQGCGRVVRCAVCRGCGLGVPYQAVADVEWHSLFTLPLHEAETTFRDIHTGCSECSGALEVSPIEIARGEVLDLDHL